MRDQIKKTAFTPVSAGLKDSEIMARMEARACEPELWTAQWAKYPDLLTARDLVSPIIVDHCSTCPNPYLLPDDDLKIFLYYADMIDSIDLASFFAEVEEVFGLDISKAISSGLDIVDAYDALAYYEASSLPYYSLLHKLLKFIESEKGSIDLEAKILEPITSETPARFIRPRLELRAQWPDLWAAQWPDEPRLLEARDRASRLIKLYSKRYWPNVFFLPGDSMEVLIWGEADSLDTIEVFMEFEEVFGIQFEDEAGLKFFHTDSSYLDFLKALLKMTDPSKDLKGLNYHWTPLKLPSNYYRRSLWGSLSRRFPIFCGHYRDELWQDDLRTAQAFRPATWQDQWSSGEHLIHLRDRVGRLLAEHLQWVDQAFIPQDRLEAVFHSRKGLRRIIKVLKIINDEFNCTIPLEFVIAGEHTFEDFLKEIERQASNQAASQST